MLAAGIALGCVVGGDCFFAPPISAVCCDEIADFDRSRNSLSYNILQHRMRETPPTTTTAALTRLRLGRIVEWREGRILTDLKE